MVPEQDVRPRTSIKIKTILAGKLCAVGQKMGWQKAGVGLVSNTVPLRGQHRLRRRPGRACGLFPIELSQNSGRTSRSPSRKHLRPEIYHGAQALALARALHMYKMSVVHVVALMRLPRVVYGLGEAGLRYRADRTRYNWPSFRVALNRAGFAAPPACRFTCLSSARLKIYAVQSPAFF